MVCHSSPAIKKRITKLYNRPEDEIYNKLMRIRDLGKATTMHLVSQTFSPHDLKQVSKYLSKQ